MLTNAQRDKHCSFQPPFSSSTFGAFSDKFTVQKVLSIKSG